MSDNKTTEEVVKNNKQETTMDQCVNAEANASETEAKLAEIDVDKAEADAKDKSYKEQVTELIKWQARLTDEQGRLESFKTSIIQQIAEIKKQKALAVHEQQKQLQEEKKKFDAGLAAIRAKKDAEIISMIESEWAKFEKEKAAQITALNKELAVIRSKADKEMADIRANADRELTAARKEAAEEIAGMKTSAKREIESAEAESRKQIEADKKAAKAAADADIEVRTRELREGEARTERESKRLTQKEQEIKALEVSIEEREAQIESDKTTNERERRRLDRERQRIKGSDENLEQEINERFSDRIDSYDRKLDAKDEELDKLRNEVAGLIATRENIESLRAAYGMDPSKIRSRIADLEARNKALLDEAANSTTRIEYDRVSSEKRALETKLMDAHEEIRRISTTDDEVQALQSKVRRLEEKNANLSVEAEEARNLQKSLQTELLRLSTPEERELDREARIRSIKRDIAALPDEETQWEPYPVEMDELEWLQSIKNQCDKYGIKFQKRILYAFHTALKINDWSIITVLAGVSGTGKSELPKLYSFFGGLNFISVAVQPNWDSQESMLGFFNSIDNQFQPEDLLSYLAKCTDKESDFRNYMSVVLLDEMNLAYVEHYFAEFLSKLEERRGKTVKDLPNVNVNLGAGVKPYQLPLLRNVLWTGTMNQDETTKSLSDKVIDRSMVINFPRPKHLAERTQMQKLKKTERKLLTNTWKTWTTNDLDNTFSKEQMGIFGEYKLIIEKINEFLEEVGRALGHRVWQSIEYYIANYPTVRRALLTAQGQVTEELKAEMRIAFEDQLVQKVMPKLRGIETRGKGRQSLQNIEDLLADEGFDNLKYDFEIACEQGYGQFVWSSAKYLGDDEEKFKEETAEENTEEIIEENVEKTSKE
ncbi:MAG: hypothetical protein ACK5LL_16795 [Suipraeoptans sp.]